MASIIPGYEYDIFISYRQKDNKYDGWVTLFVENLKKELEATFKEDVSIYFDINPQDGLLESHDVTDSLKDKLRCLIFIPIISQTYCDPKSFAWEHEFKKFIEIASNDQFGLKIKLLNGNTASRILPIKIHDLKPEDLELFESVSGGVLRGIEFIYNSFGVNRPLRANEDHVQDNLNKTYYRDQINKAARVINDTITALKSGSSGIPDEHTVKSRSVPVQNLELKVRKPLRISRPVKLGTLLVAFILLLVISFHWVKKSQNLTSEEILERVINYYDFYHSWDDYYGKIHLITLFSNGWFGEEIIEIQTRENYYKCTSYYGTDTVVQGIKDGKYFKEIKGRSTPVKSDSLGIMAFRDHHYWQFGGVMFLKSSGLDLGKNVVRTKFQGNNCLTITFSSDTNKIKSKYFKSSLWEIYINPMNYSIVGVKINGFWGRFNSSYIIFQGELDNNRIKMPLIKTYYDSQSNSLFFIDMFHKIE